MNKPFLLLSLITFCRGINVGILIDDQTATSHFIHVSIADVFDEYYYEGNNTFQVAKYARSGDSQLNVFLEAEKLALNNMDVVVGPIWSSETKFAYIVAEYYNQTVIAPAASDPEFEDVLTYPLLFNTSPTDSSQGQAIIKLLEKLGIGEIVVVASTESYGQHFSVEMDILASKASGFNIAQQYLINTDFINNLKFSEEEFHHDVDLVLQNIYDEGFKVIFLIVDADTTELILKKAMDLNMTTEKGYIFIATELVTSYESFMNIRYESLISQVDKVDIQSSMTLYASASVDDFVYKKGQFIYQRASSMPSYLSPIQVKILRTIELVSNCKEETKGRIFLIVSI